MTAEMGRSNYLLPAAELCDPDRAMPFLTSHASARAPTIGFVMSCACTLCARRRGVGVPGLECLISRASDSPYVRQIGLGLFGRLRPCKAPA